MMDDDFTPATQGSEPLDEKKISRARFTVKEIIILAILCFALFSTNLCFSVISPFFPDEAKKKGISRFEIGAIFGIFEFAVFLFSPIFGGLLPKIGTKYSFCMGLFLSGSLTALFGFIDQMESTAVYSSFAFILRLLDGIAIALYSTASFAIVSCIFSDRVSMIIGIMEVFSGLGFMIGPPLGGALFSLGGFLLPFLSTGIMMIVMSFVSIAVVPTIEGGMETSFIATLRLLVAPSVIFTGLHIISITAALSFLDPILEIYLSKYDFSPVGVGLFFLIGPACYATFSPIAGYICDKYKRLRMISLLGSLVYLAALFFTGPSPLTGLPEDWRITAVGLSISAAGFGFGCIPTFGLILAEAFSRGYPDDIGTYGIVSGLFSSFFCFGTFIGVTISSPVAERYGFAWTCTFYSFGCGFITLLVMIYAFSKHIKLAKTTRDSDERSVLL